MKGEQYIEICNYFSETKRRTSLMKSLHDILPVIMIIFYPVQLIYLLFKDGFTKGITNPDFLKFLIIPAAFLFLVSIIRYIINAKRPYEVYNFTPIAGKESKGKSFPSRHTACAFIIAMAFLYLNTGLGVVMLVLALAIGITRILCGCHFIKDVVGGAILGILCGLLFFLI